MNQREMRSALSVGLEAMGGFPSSAPDWVVTGLYELRMKAATNAATRKAQRPAPRTTGAVVVSADEQERLEAHRRIIQADLLQ